MRSWGGLSRDSVLLVDDHAIVRGGLAALLATAGDPEVVGQAADGREAVEVAAREEPDVVLMDLSMPGADGVEATRRVLARRRHLARRRRQLGRLRVIGLRVKGWLGIGLRPIRLVTDPHTALSERGTPQRGCSAPR